MAEMRARALRSFFGEELEQWSDFIDMNHLVGCAYSRSDERTIERMSTCSCGTRKRGAGRHACNTIMLPARLDFIGPFMRLAELEASIPLPLTEAHMHGVAGARKEVHTCMGKILLARFRQLYEALCQEEYERGLVVYSALSLLHQRVCEAIMGPAHAQAHASVSAGRKDASELGARVRTLLSPSSLAEVFAVADKKHSTACSSSVSTCTLTCSRVTFFFGLFLPRTRFLSLLPFLRVCKFRFFLCLFVELLSSFHFPLFWCVL